MQAARDFFARPDMTQQQAVDQASAAVRRFAIQFRRIGGVMAIVTTLEEAATLEPTFDSDLRFVGRYRVPFQYSRLVRENLKSGSFLSASSGVTVTDLDGNRFYDLTGSYGVNLLGYDFYKGAIARGVHRAGALGPVLGPYHPVIADNVRRLKAISGLDAKKMAEDIGVPFHPGAAKYYKEAGITVSSK